MVLCLISFLGLSASFYQIDESLRQPSPLPDTTTLWWMFLLWHLFSRHHLQTPFPLSVLDVGILLPCHWLSSHHSLWSTSVVLVTNYWLKTQKYLTLPWYLARVLVCCNEMPRDFSKKNFTSNWMGTKQNSRPHQPAPPSVYPDGAPASHSLKLESWYSSSTFSACLSPHKHLCEFYFLSISWINHLSPFTTNNILLLCWFLFYIAIIFIVEWSFWKISYNINSCLKYFSSSPSLSA